MTAARRGWFSSMRDLVLEDRVCGQPDGVEEPALLPIAHRSPGSRGQHRPGRTYHQGRAPRGANVGVENITPAIGAVDVAMARGAAFQHPELVEQKVGVTGGYGRNGHSRRTLPGRHGSG
ncbi:MAG: hypothetical protein IPO97_10590 [Sphingomonadales bacterium]|nr:hypothetical protein [Sphingomonadales bacterium]